jgi:hypothetical protein
MFYIKLCYNLVANNAYVQHITLQCYWLSRWHIPPVIETFLFEQFS